MGRKEPMTEDIFKFVEQQKKPFSVSELAKKYCEKKNIELYNDVNRVKAKVGQAVKCYVDEGLLELCGQAESRGGWIKKKIYKFKNGIKKEKSEEDD